MWEIRGNMLVRTHRTVRVSKFIPTNTRECPIPIEHLLLFRRTVIKDSMGRAISSQVDNWTVPGRAIERITPAWKGETRFFIQETPDFNFRSLDETVTGDMSDKREMQLPTDPYQTIHGLTEYTNDYWETGSSLDSTSSSTTTQPLTQPTI